jgi:hypothetical protein
MGRRARGRACINLAYSLFSFMLGLLYTMGVQFSSMAYFISAAAVALLLPALAYLCQARNHHSVSFFLECLLYLGVAANILLIKFWERSLLLGWTLIALESLFFLLNVASLLYRLCLRLLELRHKCADLRKVVIK